MTKRLNKKPESLDIEKRIVSKEEKDLWQKVIIDVEPLAISEKQTDLAFDQEDNETFKRPHRLNINITPKSFNKKLLHGIAPGLDRATKQKMRRGKIKIEARIDLHGLTQNEAYKNLEKFLYNCRAEGLRSVLVITGKGLGGEGVLRAAVPKWLNEGHNQQIIRAFSYAAPKDGGEGALYVMLKRLK
jgi:DNA-nicking Smr family endonuclease